MADSGGQRRRSWAALAALTLGVAAVCAVTISSLWISQQDEESELLLKIHLAAHEPYSPPANLYLWWGDTTNHRFVGSGEHIRHLLAMGQIEGGEWRDPMFLGNNGVATFRSQRFRRISESCCSTIVMPPFEWDFPVYNTHKVIGQRIRNFVANGNMLVLTGGIMAVEFINSYFFYNIELADGNYSPGPFRRLPQVPDAMKNCPSVLPQKGIAVTAVKKESLPSGSQVLWGTPRSSAVFMIKFCEAQNPMDGMPPVKVLPRDCPRSERAGRPCSCGNIMYIGYDFKEQYPTRYDHVLRASVEILSPTSVASATPKKLSSQVQSLHSMDQESDVWHDDASVSADGGNADAASGEAVHSTALSTVGAKDGDAESVNQKIAMQKLEIRHLKNMLTTLDTERKAVHKFTEKKARVSQLAQFRNEAAHLIDEIRDAEGGKDDEEDDGDEKASSRGENGGEKLLLKSVAALAKDVRKVDEKVDKLADKEKERAKSSGGDEENVKEGDEHEAKKESKSDARTKQQLAEYKKKAEKYKEELAFEQSVPSPEYSYAEPDHATPYFSDEHREAKHHSSETLSKLKDLVEKTRESIAKELNAAMRG